MNKNTGTIQVDVDGLWTFQKFFGKPYVLDVDQLFDFGIKVFLDLFARTNIKATFFINVKDLDIKWKRTMIAKIALAGHEIANHGFSHPYLNQISFEQKREEIKKSTEILSMFLGKKVCGFRAPGYAIDNQIIDILEEFGYTYDSSVFPTILSPLLKVLQKSFFRYKHIGYSYSMFAPLNPYHISSTNYAKKGKREIVEIPVTVSPFLRMPLHFSYLIPLGKHHFNFELSLIKFRKMTPNFIFHLVDLIPDSGLNALADLPMPKKPFSYRINLAETVLERLSTEFDLLTSVNLCQKYFGISSLGL